MVFGIRWNNVSNRIVRKERSGDKAGMNSITSDDLHAIFSFFQVINDVIQNFNLQNKKRKSHSLMSKENEQKTK